MGIISAEIVKGGIEMGTNRLKRHKRERELIANRSCCEICGKPKFVLAVVDGKVVCDKCKGGVVSGS